MDRRAVTGLFGGGLCTGGYGLLSASTNNKLYEPVQLVLAVTGSAMVTVGVSIILWLMVTAVRREAQKKERRAELRMQIWNAEELQRRWREEDSEELASETLDWANKVLSYLNEFDKAAAAQFVSSAGFSKMQFALGRPRADQHRNYLEVRIFQLDRIIEAMK